MSKFLGKRNVIASNARLLVLRINYFLQLNLFSLLALHARYIKACRKYLKRLNSRIRRAVPSKNAILQTDISRFDISCLQQALKLLGKDAPIKNVKLDPQNVCFWATEIYDTGGHTELILRMLPLFDKYHNHFVEADAPAPSLAPNKLKKIAQFAELHQVQRGGNIKSALLQCYNTILATKAKNILVFIHPDDIVSAIAMGLLKMHTDANIIFIPHADHLLNFGIEWADVILGGRQVTRERLPRYLHKFVACPNIPNYNFAITDNEIGQLKNKLGISASAYVTLTGCPGYKIFSDPSLAYWHFIKKLLDSEPKIKHIFISEISARQKNLAKNIFVERPDLWDRIIFLEPVHNFADYIAISDLLIDSFPISSSLTHLDVITQNKPTVIKLGEDPNFSFESCLYAGYEYACKDLDEMLDKTLELLRDDQAKAHIVQKLSDYFDKTYHPKIFKKLYASVLVLD